MRILHKVLTAVVDSLRLRGGVLHEDAVYWLGDLKKAADEGVDVTARMTALEEKIDYLAEHVGLKDPDDPGPVVAEIVVDGDLVEGYEDEDEDDYDG